MVTTRGGESKSNSFALMRKLAISGQAPKDLYNECSLSDVKGTLSWQNGNKFIFCTPR